MASTLTLVRVGTERDGDPARLRSDVAPAWRAACALVKARLNIDLSERILQAQGAYSKSGATHLDGTAVDIRVWSLSRAQINAVVALLRECGFAATWYRAGGQWEGNEHIHAAAFTSRWSNASYQVIAVKAGRDGLGWLGRQGKDTHPAPGTWRNVAEGAVWAVAQLAPKPAAKPAPAKPASNAIPRHYSKRPFAVVTVDGILGAKTLDRLRQQLNIRPNGNGAWDHWTIRALKVWLGNPDDGKGVLSPLHVRQLQYRVGLRGKQQTGVIDKATVAALQGYLNRNRK